MSDRERYPLSWPEGWKRSLNRERARFRRETHKYENGTKMWTGSRGLSVSEANERILRELRNMGVHDSLISTNLVLTSFGTPRSGQREPADPGVAVYWNRKGKPQCMAIDRYDRVADNLAAIAATLDAMRAIERHGGAQILERAFLGFAQLPERVGKPWRDVLQFHPNAFVTANTVQDRFRVLASKRHPDSGGSHDSMSELNAARAQALAELEAK